MTTNNHQQTALCCRCFTLAMSPEEIWENYQHWVVEGWREVAKSQRHMWRGIEVPLDANGRGEIDGIEWLVEHLRYIGYRAWEFGRYEHVKTGREVLHFYTCDLLNRRTGMCRDYANRHYMCRVYRVCEHPSACESIWCGCHPVGQFIGEYTRDVLGQVRLAIARCRCVPISEP